MGFGLCKINAGGISVDTNTERGVFQFDLEFCGVDNKRDIQFVNKTLAKITVEDMIDLFNRKNKAGKYKESS